MELNKGLESKKERNCAKLTNIDDLFGWRIAK